MAETEKMTRVYRVEDEAGRGAYRGPNAVPWNIHEVAHGYDPSGYEDNTPVPLPSQDEGLKALYESDRWDHEYIFGFPTLEAYDAWFKSAESKKMLEKIGLTIGVYEVEASAAHHGHKQSVFLRKKATLIERRSPVL